MAAIAAPAGLPHDRNLWRLAADPRGSVMRFALTRELAACLAMRDPARSIALQRQLLFRLQCFPEFEENASDAHLRDTSRRGFVSAK